MFNQIQAYREGWCVATHKSSEYFPEGWTEIQFYGEDENHTFPTDWHAQAFVVAKAAEGSFYHLSAVEYCEQANFKLIKGI